jgi:hypothetical protein
LEILVRVSGKNRERIPIRTPPAIGMTTKEEDRKKEGKNRERIP